MSQAKQYVIALALAASLAACGGSAAPAAQEEVPFWQGDAVAVSTGGPSPSFTVSNGFWDTSVTQGVNAEVTYTGDCDLATATVTFAYRKGDTVAPSSEYAVANKVGPLAKGEPSSSTYTIDAAFTPDEVIFQFDDVECVDGAIGE